MFRDWRFYNRPTRWAMIVAVPILVMMVQAGFAVAFPFGHDTPLLMAAFFVACGSYMAYVPASLAVAAVLEDVASGVVVSVHLAGMGMWRYLLSKMVLPLAFTLAGSLLDLAYMWYGGVLTAGVIPGVAISVSMLAVGTLSLLPFCMGTVPERAHGKQNSLNFLQIIIMLLFMGLAFVGEINSTLVLYGVCVALPLLLAAAGMVVTVIRLNRMYPNTVVDMQKAGLD
ncbi:hypothetical protein [Bifidobacterium aquikefiricola]|uniref:Uncharacterized protein n=1 Tax=Bifidobacterium aquikefiricola TaxID=3059038 RepID=A0AB39U7F7_9BIFI